MDLHRPRDYQLEMFELSMRENIIAVMPTGSGKTYLASMRIMAELERCQNDQMIWFLVPTKLLCSQQLTYITHHMPAVGMRMLTGDDGVECWSNQETWNTALRDVQVVFSTYAVLADALTHGFVRLERLALLVFDEAHHCMKSHPANCIMQDFYHPLKQGDQNDRMSKVLGLTASVDISKIGRLEQNLDATCRAPFVNDKELAEFSPCQKFTRVAYSQMLKDTTDQPACLHMLNQVATNLAVHPENDDQSFHEGLSKIHGKAYAVFHQLGEWACTFFLQATIKKAILQMSGQGHQFLHRGGGHVSTVRKSLAMIIGEISAAMNVQDGLSDKAARLLAFLKEKHCADFSGIIFVRERATAYLLSALINKHPLVQGLFRCAPCVGSNFSPGNWSNSISGGFDQGEDAIEEFRSGAVNIIVATNVLEEGIDVPKCQLVISFDIPDNQRSYIQRRGRARQKISEFVVMEETEDSSLTSQKMDDLEAQMQQICSDHSRQRRPLEVDGDRLGHNSLYMRLDSGALLTTTNAVAHLYHFCTTLQGKTGNFCSPSFSYKRNKEGLIQSTVYLPSGFDPSVQVAEGRHWFGTKHSARQEAAFQSVCKLHYHNLIDDHLLPLLSKTWFDEIQPRLSESELPRTHSAREFWKAIPSSWSERKLYRSRILFSQNGVDQDDLTMAIFAPLKLPTVEMMDLFWDEHTTFTVTLQPLNLELEPSHALRSTMRDISTVLFQSTRGASPPQAYPTFLPFFAPDLPLEELKDWLDIHQGSLTISRKAANVSLLSPSGFIRSPTQHLAPLIFVRWIKPCPGANGFSIECRPFHKRRNLICRGKSLQAENSRYNASRMVRVTAADCTIHFVPWKMCRATLLIPPMVQQLYQHLQAQSALIAIFGDVTKATVGHVAEAITAPISQWPINYQRLEFLGDSLLKFIVTVDIFEKYPHWHEGYLSRLRDSVVSNERLAVAGVRSHLEQFICADFITQKHPIFSESGEIAATQKLSKKKYADVIEALVAAAHESGGIPLSRSLIYTLLPEVFDSLPKSQQARIPANLHHFSEHLELKLDDLLSFKFDNRDLLWEALTHPSWQRDQSTSSYQRLEFLGDAVLDFIVARMLHSRHPKLAEGRMTQLRAALVNADFLAFLCLEFSQPRICQQQHGAGFGSDDTAIPAKELALWMFMRHDSQDVIKMHRVCGERYHMLRGAVKRNLEQDKSYSWALLAQLGASKFYSDLVESIIGAIYVDSEGNLEACERFLQRLGLISLFERLVEQGVSVEHPKNAFDYMTSAQDTMFQVEKAKDESHSIAVWLNGEKVVCLHGCLSKNEAVVRGAEAAVLLLTERNSTACAY